MRTRLLRTEKEDVEVEVIEAEEAADAEEEAEEEGARHPFLSFLS